MTKETNESVKNPEPNGNAWFVNEIKEVSTADEEIVALDSLKTKETAVINTSKFPEAETITIQQDSLSNIKLVDYKLNHLTYEAKTTSDQFAVFSEVYYKGWNAYIDGELTPHYQVNYLLRGMQIPSGEHTIEFKFEPQVIQTGSTISLVSYALLIFIPLGWFFYERKKKTTD